MGCSYLSLGLIVLMGFCGYRKHQEKQALHQMVEFKEALDRFSEDCGRYPDSDEGLAALIVKPAYCGAWNRYLETDAIPKDPLGHEYVYSVAETSFQIISGGRKGEISDDITVEGSSAETKQRGIRSLSRACVSARKKCKKKSSPAFVRQISSR